VPVIRDVDRKSAAIESAVRDFATKSRDGTLSLEDPWRTFTITNGGVRFDAEHAYSGIRRSGILGLHNIQDRYPRREIVIRPMMYVALSYDHRIVGLPRRQFLVRVKFN
jgi:2-oxoglutarate dehydrogenase E2 component (dihydrolipoamide succinyltransferase)